MSTTVSPPDGSGAPRSARPALRARVEARIRALHARTGSLRRVHRTHPALYAQARRAFGSWRDAVQACGLDYGGEVDRSLREGLRRRDERRAVGRVLARFLADHPGADPDVLAAREPELAGRVADLWGDLGCALAWLEGRG